MTTCLLASPFGRSHAGRLRCGQQVGKVPGCATHPRGQSVLPAPGAPAARRALGRLPCRHAAGWVDASLLGGGVRGGWGRGRTGPTIQVEFQKGAVRLSVGQSWRRRAAVGSWSSQLPLVIPAPPGVATTPPCDDSLHPRTGGIALLGKRGRRTRRVSSATPDLGRDQGWFGRTTARTFKAGHIEHPSARDVTLPCRVSGLGSPCHLSGNRGGGEASPPLSAMTRLHSARVPARRELSRSGNGSGRFADTLSISTRRPVVTGQALV